MSPLLQQGLDDFLYPEPKELQRRLANETGPRFRQLNRAVVQLLDEFSLVAFTPLDIKDEERWEGRPSGQERLGQEAQWQWQKIGRERGRSGSRRKVRGMNGKRSTWQEVGGAVAGTAEIKMAWLGVAVAGTTEDQQAGLEPQAQGQPLPAATVLLGRQMPGMPPQPAQGGHKGGWPTQ
eukprot:355126-Chlamydomonas_euryale.AAC.3